MVSYRVRRSAVVILTLLVALLIAASMAIFVARSVAAGLARHRAVAINCPPSVQTSGGDGPGC
jgi:hypothetical protein